MVLPEENPIYGPFFGVMGAASAIIFSGKISWKMLSPKWPCEFVAERFLAAIKNSPTNGQSRLKTGRNLVTSCHESQLLHKDPKQFESFLRVNFSCVFAKKKKMHDALPPCLQLDFSSYSLFAHHFKAYTNR